MFGFSIRRRLCSASAIIAGAAVLFAGLPAVADTSQAATANVDSTSVAPAVDVQAANLSSSAPTAAAAATKPLTCVPGVVYSVLSTGQVRQLAAASGTNVKAVDAPGGLSSFNGLGIGGEGFPTSTIAGPTGEGLTRTRNFARVRRCVLVDDLNVR